MTQIHQVGIKLLHPNAKIPTKANSTDSCYDVVAVRREALELEEITPSAFFNIIRVYGYKYHLTFPQILSYKYALEVLFLKLDLS